MILSGHQIKSELGKNIKIEPFSEKQLNPNSYNLRLHKDLKIYRPTRDFGTLVYLDSKRDNATREIEIPEDGYCLKPGVLYLGRTVEWTETYNLVPMINGRSSAARLGISVHVTAGFGDVGYKGFWTLEITVIHPVVVYPNQEICQIYYQPIVGEFSEYSGKYQGTSEVIPSKMFQDFDGQKES